MIRSLRQQPYTLSDSHGPTRHTSLRDSKGKKMVLEAGPQTGVISSLRIAADKTRSYNHPGAAPHEADKDKQPKGQMSKDKERRVIKEMIEKELFATASDPEPESDDDSGDEKDAPRIS